MLLDILDPDSYLSSSNPSCFSKRGFQTTRRDLTSDFSPDVSYLDPDQPLDLTSSFSWKSVGSRRVCEL